MILDEPTNGLDPTQILHMRALIRELSRSATVIVSTHILQEVQAVCERVLILRAGRKVVDARLDELQRDARLLVTLDRDDDERTAGAAARRRRALGAVGRDAGGRYRYALQADESVAPAVSACGLSRRLCAIRPESRAAYARDRCSRRSMRSVPAAGDARCCVRV